MVEVILVLLGISFILFFGFLAEFAFKKTGIPDILFLILLGLFLGPNVLGYINPAQLAQLAPVFTTFALLFLLYDGAFSIDLASFAKGFFDSIKLTMLNFFTSVFIVAAIMLAFGFTPAIALLAGFILVGTSSAFVIPVIKQLKIKSETYSILALESAITDVLCIVFSLTMIELISLNVFNAQAVVSQIVSLFAIAGLVGIAAGVLWIFLVFRVFKEHKSYMITIAYLLLVFVLTEFLNGNGAIAALFFGLVLRNSEQLTSMFAGLVGKKYAVSYKKVEAESEVSVKKTISQGYGISVTSKEEQFFYSQISFILKVFFFVYIGILLNFADQQAVLIGLIIALAIYLSRKASRLASKGMPKFDARISEAIFARGLAAAAIAQILVFSNIQYASRIENIVYAAIIFSIIASSIAVFAVKKKQSLELAQA